MRTPGPADVLLADGSVAVVRPLLPGDRELLLALNRRVSDDNLRLRFFTAGRKSADDYVEHLVTSDDVLSLVAERAGRVVAVATAEPTGPLTSEVAFLVEDGMHGLGIGSLLLEHLAAEGRRNGLTRFEAEVLSDNHAMLGVFVDAGFAAVRHRDGSTVRVELDISASEAAVAAADARECRSEARSLRPLLRPGSVAVVGARRDGTGVGAAVLRSIVAGGFTGPVYAVHPTAAEIEGVPARPTFTALPRVVDLAVVAVPAQRAVEALRDVAAAGVPAAVVLSSGFEELGPAGAVLQAELLDVARRGSVRVVGPNCLGLLSNDPDVRLDATFSGAVPPAGGLAVASQSGGVGIVLMDAARELGLGIGSFVSLGNKVDVSSNDLLAAWLDDPGVSAAALYLESFGNAPKFARFARMFAERKPLLAVVGGRSAGGKRAGASHTAAAASASVGIDALFAQAGVIGCDGAEDMARTALLLAEQPLPQGPRLAILSNAGGMGVLAADAADRWGLVVPELSAGLRARLARHVSGTTGTSNPVDVGAGAGAAEVEAVLEELLTSAEVDAVVMVPVRTGTMDTASIVGGVARARGRHGEKPFVWVPMGGLQADGPPPAGTTTLPSIEAAVQAVGRAWRYASWRATPRLPAPPGDPVRAAAAREVADALLASSRAATGEESPWLEPDEMRPLLAGHGLAPHGREAVGPDEAAHAAAELGFPVVVKVADRRVVHKTERGLVRVGLTSTGQVADAVRDFGRELGRVGVPVLVQPVLSGTEVAAGLVRDPVFGPLVMVAAGGVATDVWDDRVFLLPPVTPGDALRALQSLRIRPLLEGFRGSRPVDLAALQDLVVRLGRLAEDVPQVVELDLNPVLANPDGAFLVDVKVRLAAADGVEAGQPRQLRRPVARRPGDRLSPADAAGGRRTGGRPRR